MEYPSIAAHLSVDGVFLVSALAAARAGDVQQVVAKFSPPLSCRVYIVGGHVLLVSALEKLVSALA